MSGEQSLQAQRPEPPVSRSHLLREYMVAIAATDRLPLDDLRPVLMGLFGEVGSIMATAKKLHREKEAYAGYRRATNEEFGDVLWYFAALCRRLDVDLNDILSDATHAEEQSKIIAVGDRHDGPDSPTSRVSVLLSLDETLLNLGEAVAALLGIEAINAQTRKLLRAFGDEYFRALKVARLTFSGIVYDNIAKTRGRFVDPDPAQLPTFDETFAEEERLPRHFEVKITQRKSGQSFLQWNGVFIGDPLKDNILEPDGYRFHDVFHFAHAAVLHWSPTFRALIKQKRKSDQEVDETQDGGRAIVVEEGLTAWIFSRAKELKFFEGQTSVSFDLLKAVQQFVRGYEVEACPLKLWECAILHGYEVFRQVRDNNGGIVIGDRDTRTITYQRIDED